MTALPFKYGVAAPLRLIAGVVVMVLLGIATLWFLAPPDLSLEGFGLHVWKCLVYTRDFALYALAAGTDTRLETLHVASATTAAISALVPVLMLASLIIMLARLRGNPNDSRFANMSEVKRMGLHGDLGPVLGLHDGEVLKPSETRHTCIVAPTRAGKTRQGISTVLDWPGSIVVIDPKSDIRKITDPYRSKLGPTYAINWADPNTPHGWNFLALRSIPKTPSSASARHCATRASWCQKMDRPRTLSGMTRRGAIQPRLSCSRCARRYVRGGTVT